MKLQVAAKGVISNESGEVLIVRESNVYEEGTETGVWDVVGGRIGSSEPLLTGLCREIKEESGLTVSPGRLLGVTETFPHINGEAHHIIRVYYACIAMSDEVTLSADHDQYEWFDPNNHHKWNIMEDLHEIFDNYLKLV